MFRVLYELLKMVVNTRNMKSCLQKCNKLNKSHLVGQLLNSIHDARTHVYYIYIQNSETRTTAEMKNFWSCTRHHLNVCNCHNLRSIILKMESVRISVMLVTQATSVLRHCANYSFLSL